VPAHPFAPTTVGSYGTSPQIDESDPLGLNGVDIDELHLARNVATPAARPVQRQAPPAETNEAASTKPPDAPHEPDLSVIAAMARQVEDARFAAERRLHDKLRTTALPPTGAAPVVTDGAGRPAIDPVVRRIAAQSGSRAGGAVAATAALRELLSDANPASAPQPLPETVAETVAENPVSTDAGAARPTRMRSEPESAPAALRSGTDTASLLRELASLSDETGPVPPSAAPRQPIRPAAATTPSRARRKGLFTR
jgi:hypothetical protein